MAGSNALRRTEPADPDAASRFASAAQGYGAFVAAAPHRNLRAGPLSGLSFALKDMFDWEGRPPTCGLAKANGPVPARDASLIASLLENGASCAGLVEMTPLAYEASGGNFERGRPRNPLDATRICGGSSSGPAVAVAAGLADFGVGSDTAGSLRIPAQCCGIASWKPSLGLLPLEGAMPLAPSFDVPGFLARDVAILSRLADAVAPRVGDRAMRLAIASDLDCADAGLLERLAGELNATQMALRPVLDACDPPMLMVLQTEAARIHAATLAKISPDPAFARRIGKGLEISDADLDAARATIKQLRANAETMLFASGDAILLPVMPIATPLVAECEPASPTFSARTLYRLAEYTRFVSALGLPAVVMPMGRDGNGMPVGVQIIARHGADAELIALAQAIASVGPNRE